MSTKENAASPVQTISYTESAQARLRDLQLMRDLIPHFRMPTSANETNRLSSAASLPPQFIELSAVAVTNQTALVRADGASGAEVRDLMSYGDAFSPVADELEALAQFVRYSVAAARNKAGREALTTYSLAQRLAKHPETAYLAPYVADMRRALGRGQKPSDEVVAKRGAAKAAKAAAVAAMTTTEQQPRKEQS